MHSQYDGVHWVAKLVRYLVELVQNDSRLSAGRKAASWAELLTFKPRTYLRLALAMDLSMSSGRIPDQKDFPARLEAKVLRTLAGPGRAIRIHEGGLAPRRETVTADDLTLGADFFEVNNSTTPNSQGRQESRSHEGDSGASFADVTGEGDQDAQQSEATDLDLDGLGPLSAEMESFFDPILNDLAAAGENLVEDSSRDFGSDNEAIMLTA